MRPWSYAGADGGSPCHDGRPKTQRARDCAGTSDQVEDGIASVVAPVLPRTEAVGSRILGVWSIVSQCSDHVRKAMTSHAVLTRSTSMVDNWFRRTSFAFRMVPTAGRRRAPEHRVLVGTVRDAAGLMGGAQAVLWQAKKVLNMNDRRPNLGAPMARMEIRLDRRTRLTQTGLDTHPTFLSATVLSPHLRARKVQIANQFRIERRRFA